MFGRSSRASTAFAYLLQQDQQFARRACLYLVTGMSQVMLSVECIVKYKNFSIRESEDLDSCQKKIRVQRNSTILQITYIGILVFSLAVIFGFIVVQLLYIFQHKSSEHSYALELPLGILNLTVWLFLCWSTLSFVSMINKRFGSDFANAKCKLFVTLSLFSISFLIRASWDLWIKWHPDMDLQSNDGTTWAIILFTLYFFTEWLPLGVVYLVHFLDFYKNWQNERSPMRDENASILERQQLELLLAHSPQKPERREVAAIKINTYSSDQESEDIRLRQAKAEQEGQKIVQDTNRNHKPNDPNESGVDPHSGSTPKVQVILQSNIVSDDNKTEYNDARFRLRCTDMMQTDVFSSSERSREKQPLLEQTNARGTEASIITKHLDQNYSNSLMSRPKSPTASSPLQQPLVAKSFAQTGGYPEGNSRQTIGAKPVIKLTGTLQPISSAQASSNDVTSTTHDIGPSQSQFKQSSLIGTVRKTGQVNQSHESNEIPQMAIALEFRTPPKPAITYQEVYEEEQESD